MDGGPCGLGPVGSIIFIGALILVVGFRGVLGYFAIIAIPIITTLAGALVGVALFGKDSIGPIVCGGLGFLAYFKLVDFLIPTGKQEPSGASNPPIPPLPGSSTEAQTGEAYLRSDSPAKSEEPEQPNDHIKSSPPASTNDEQGHRAPIVEITHRAVHGRAPIHPSQSAADFTHGADDDVDGADHDETEFVATTPPPTKDQARPRDRLPPGARLGGESQLVGQQGLAALQAISLQLPTTAGFLVFAGESQIRYVVVHGEDLHASFEAFVSLAASNFNLMKGWLKFTAHGFSQPRLVRVVEAVDSDSAALLASQEYERLDAIKGGCVHIWPFV